MESDWDSSAVQSSAQSETTQSQASTQTPIVKEDSLIGSNKHIRYVLGRQPTPPPAPDPDPVVAAALPISRPSSPTVWQVAALLTFTFILGTACCFFILRGLNKASADTQIPRTPSSAPTQSVLDSAPASASSDQHSPPAPFNPAITRAFPTTSSTLAANGEPVETFRSGVERPATPMYSIVDLGPVAPISGMGQGHVAINSHGDVAFTTLTDGEKRAWLWSHDRREEIAGLGGRQCEVRALNDFGGAAGFAEVSGSSAVHAFYRHKAVTSDLGNLAGGDSFGLERTIAPRWSELPGCRMATSTPSYGIRRPE